MVATLKFRGSNCLRQRIILSLLTGKSLIIEDIRPDEDGMNDYEINLLELVQKITNGTRIQIRGTRLQFNPGSLIGGEFTHNCHVQRSISYYLELLLSVAAFCKKPLQATLNGVTNDQIDPNVDALKASALPLIKRFIGDVEGTKLDIKVNARGFKPEGGGQILFSCPIVRQLQPVRLEDDGKVKRVRGVAVAARVSPQTANRMIETSKGLLLQFLPDVYIYSDHNKGKQSGLSPGFSITLVAETTEGCTYTSSAVSNAKGSGDGPSVPEDVAKEATYMLYEEIQRGGCVDSTCQSLVLTLMAFNQKDVSKVKLGELTTYTIHFLRHLKEFCGLTFQLDSSAHPYVIATCQGIGFKNLSRPTR
ncbi:uncharacterized protein LOC126804757 [Argentina anserina]|uniref:uncharacterized protein LOC126804757 n=1 Tax=Argentina anserina TaxID=57926 RepID=UPI0021763C31|nr:uncharacterized protein LOC126804757 [Potentilla anserina]